MSFIEKKNTNCFKTSTDKQSNKLVYILKQHEGSRKVDIVSASNSTRQEGVTVSAPVEVSFCFE